MDRYLHTNVQIIMTTKDAEFLDKNNSPEKSEEKGVNFIGPSSVYPEKRPRYLTAKYDKKTRQRIGERLKVENFIFEQLRILYQTETDEYDCNLDLEDILAIDTDEERQRMIEVSYSFALHIIGAIIKCTL
ncbi:unnamed protein product [Protopolystoma xenopodis]|uniref:Uncharacterized protein n=1 Tax=Protopolystoma xenopodis TaxID=117903 RepID=A0A448X566_9PLAT|nr:unnamed protein product [Protopolystoma xenopodis]